MDSHTINLIITVASYLLPTIIAYLLKSPLGTHIPAAVADVLENLDASAIRELYDAVDTAAERRETAVNAIITISAKYGITVSSKTAAAIVDYITARLKKLAK